MYNLHFIIRESITFIFRIKTREEENVSNYLHCCLVKFPYLQENKANVFSNFYVSISITKAATFEKK